KTEVRFRQQSRVHDFVRDSLRVALMKARPAAEFLTALKSAPLASPTLMPPSTSPLPGAPSNAAGELTPESEPQAQGASEAESFQLTARLASPAPVRLPFEPGGFRPGSFAGNFGMASTAVALLEGELPQPAVGCGANHEDSAASTISPGAATAQVEAEQAAQTLNHLGSLKPLGQLRESFILATGEEGLWIIDQHVAHERILFEKILHARNVENVQRQRLLMPLLVELKPWQIVVFAQIADELERNGFEVEPFGPQTLAVK